LYVELKVNFISNAIKYGAGEVRVTVSQVDSDNDKKTRWCRICVEDNGDGISDEFKTVIFDAFSRGDQSRNRETGGFGLGLAIVARIMEWHQGEASIADSDLGGAAFTLTWPIE
jgi:two-component system OmpR family sensor kinase/two-component system sensor histidine kinase RstB